MVHSRLDIVNDIQTLSMVALCSEASAWVDHGVERMPDSSVA